MPEYDFSPAVLHTYRSAVVPPADFDAFWSKTLAETRVAPVAARFEPADYGLTAFDVFDLTYAGFGGHPVRGWFILPKGATGRLPLVVRYIGYGGGRSLPYDHLVWPAAGYAHLVMDTRGQGSAWSPGDTPDPVGSDPASPGFMTRGILDREAYYYRRVFTDAVRAIEAGRGHPAVDPDKVAVDREVGVDFGIGAALGNAHGAWKIAEERHVGHHRLDRRLEPGGGERDATALAAPDHRDLVGIDPRMAAPGLDGAHRVGEHPPVVIGLAVEDAAGHEAGRGRIGADGIGRVAGRPGAALAARVHHQVRVAGGGPDEPLVREPASAAVPEVLHDGGQRRVAGAGGP
jgi:hypothetical protein